MDCLKEPDSTHRVELLTHLDKTLRLVDVFSVYHRNSDIFLPSDDFYQEITGPESIEAMAAEIFSFLGIKHRSIEFHIDSEAEEPLTFVRQSGTTKITLGWHCMQDPLLAGSLIAHGIVHHLLNVRAKIHLSDIEETEYFTDLGTVYAGLAVVVMNGFASKQTCLGSMAKTNYVAECYDYYKEHRIVPSVWQAYVEPSVIALHGDRPLPSQRYKTAIRKRLEVHSMHKRNLIIGSGITAIVFGIIGYNILSAPRFMSDEMLAHKESITLLKQQQKQCEETVQRKQQTWDTSDIFILRQIEADKTRCASLRNRYNFEVTQYNANL